MSIQPDRSTWWEPELQEITLEPLEGSGWILDIGGGGEGVIGQIHPQRVVAIDRLESELREAPAGPLKLVMDARELGFLEDSFETVTAFFTFFYIPPADQPAVFKEIHRVTKPGGVVWLWDASIPYPPPGDKKVAIFQLKIHIPGRVIDTGYGTRWPACEVDCRHFARLAEEAGFKVEQKDCTGLCFRLKLVKPAASRE